MELSKRLKRNADIKRQFAETTKERTKLAYYLAKKYNISRQMVYQILELSGK
jgi:Mor family transcriptional regulator